MALRSRPACQLKHDTRHDENKSVGHITKIQEGNGPESPCACRSLRIDSRHGGAGHDQGDVGGMVGGGAGEC